MTKKDYLRAVDTIQATNTTETEFQLLIETFIDFFKDDNLKFSPDRFREACESNEK